MTASIQENKSIYHNKLIMESNNGNSGIYAQRSTSVTLKWNYLPPWQPSPCLQTAPENKPPPRAPIWSLCAPPTVWRENRDLSVVTARKQLSLVCQTPRSEARIGNCPWCPTVPWSAQLLRLFPSEPFQTQTPQGLRVLKWILFVHLKSHNTARDMEPQNVLQGQSKFVHKDPTIQ